MQVFMHKYICISPGSGIDELLGRFMLAFLKNCQTVCPSGCTILHSQQWYVRVSIFTSLPTLLSVLSFIAILVLMKWHLIVIVICIFLLTKDVKHLFICCIIFDEMSVHIFWILFKNCLFLIIELRRLLHVLDKSVLFNVCLSNFSPCHSFLFLTMSLKEQKFLFW